MRALAVLLFLISTASAQFTAGFYTHWIAPAGTLPATCAVGQLIQKTGSGAGYYWCSTTNVWSGPFSTVGFTNPMNGADQIIGSGSSSSGTPTNQSLPNGIASYSTSTHLWSVAANSDASHTGPLSSTDWSIFNAKAPTASPGFTGTPTAPTPTQADNSTKLATTAYADAVPGTKWGAWSTYTTTVSPAGSMTLTSASQAAAYVQNGKTVLFRIYYNATVGGTPSSSITFTLPVQDKNSVTQIVPVGSTNQSIFTVAAINASPTTGDSLATVVSTGNFAAGAVRLFLSGSYEAN